MKSKRDEWVVELRYPRTDIVLTDRNGNVVDLVWGRWFLKSGPFATEKKAKTEAGIVSRIEKAKRSGGEVRLRLTRSSKFNDACFTAFESLALRVCRSSFANTRDKAPEALDPEMIEIVDDARAALGMREGE